MAPPKTQFKKIPKPVYIEPELIRFMRRESLNNGDCFHNENGSFSEYMRRAVKSWLLNKYPKIIYNQTLKNVDWNEAY